MVSVHELHYNKWVSVHARWPHSLLRTSSLIAAHHIIQYPLPSNTARLHARANPAYQIIQYLPPSTLLPPGQRTMHHAILACPHTVERGL